MLMALWKCVYSF